MTDPIMARLDRIRDFTPTRLHVEQMEAALRAVLDEHRRAEQYQRLAGSPRASEWEHYCPADQKTWPCPTYRAIADALGIETEGGDR